MAAAKIAFDEEVAKGFVDAAERAGGGLPGFLGIRITDAGPGTMAARLDVREDLMTPFGNI